MFPADCVLWVSPDYSHIQLLPEDEDGNPPDRPSYQRWLGPFKTIGDINAHRWDEERRAAPIHDEDGSVPHPDSDG